MNYLENISKIVHGEPVSIDYEWKYVVEKTTQKSLPDFMEGKVYVNGKLLKFDFLNMEYDLEYNELTVGEEDIELNGSFKCKNKESRELFSKLNDSNYKDKLILKNLREYVKSYQRDNKENYSITDLIYELLEVDKVGVHNNDLIQAVSDLLMDAELFKTYNGYVMPQKNNICKPIREKEIIKFIKTVCNVSKISNITIKDVLSFFNDEVEPSFNKIVLNNGYYDFNEGMFYEESDEPLVIKKASPYNYREELIDSEPPSKLKKFLEETFTDDLNKIDQLLEIFGYMLDDGNMYQIIPFFSGAGRNGKGVCLDLLSKLVNDNTSAVDIFSVDFGSKYSSPLVESDINIMNEIKSTKNLAEVKEYIGQGGLHLAKIYEQGRKYVDIELPKSILATNNFKGLGDNIDLALMKRLTVYIEFNNIVPPEKQNPFILQELVGEEDSMDWLLTNSLYLYQQIRNAGVSGKFQADHSIDELTDHLEKYINPVVHNIKKCFTYNNDKWEEKYNNVSENWDCFVGMEDIKECLSLVTPEVKLMKSNKLKNCILDAFDLMDTRSRHPDDYEGYWVICRPYNSELKEQKAIIRGVLKY